MNQCSFAAVVGTGNAGILRFFFNVFAFGIIGTGDKSPEFSLSLDHLRSAFGAGFLQRFAFLFDHALLVTAVGIPGARLESPVPAFLDDQLLSAFRTIFLGRNPLGFDAVLLHRLLQVLVEEAVIGFEILLPVCLSFGDRVESFLQAGGEFEFHQIGEVFDQIIIDEQSQIGGNKFSLVFDDIHSPLNSGNDGGVGAGTADTPCFQLFDEGAFGVPGRGLGEMLFRIKLQELQGFALYPQWKDFPLSVLS